MNYCVRLHDALCFMSIFKKEEKRSTTKYWIQGETDTKPSRIFSNTKKQDLPKC